MSATARRLRAARLVRQAQTALAASVSARNAAWQGQRFALADPTYAARRAADLSRQAAEAWDLVARAAEANADNARQAV